MNGKKDKVPGETIAVETLPAVEAAATAPTDTKPDPAIKPVKLKNASFRLSEEDLALINTNRGLRQLLKQNHIRLKPVLTQLQYEKELKLLQVELVKLQRWVQETDARVAILFEGRDAAGKGGAIRRFIEHLNPRSMRVVALPKPSEEEQGQWYFQRYTLELPNKGEIVFFDRSWYNRAVVEPVNGFCTEAEYQRFMQQVPEFENMLYEDGVTIIKFWFSISKDEQLRRFESRKINPLKQWKLSPIDNTAQELWDKYSEFKEEMFSKTHTSFCPWIIVKANDKRRARLEAIRYLLNLLPYKGKNQANVNICHDPNVVARHHRAATRLD
jgi:polyphosphate kinase